MKSKKIKMWWKQMTPKLRRRLAFAVFLMFSVMGPITLLMESKLRIIPWSTLAAQTVAIGGLAASFILFNGRKWLLMAAIAFWAFAFVMSSGGISFLVQDGKLQTSIGGVDARTFPSAEAQLHSLTPAELDAIYTQRSIIGLVAITLIAFGYARVIYVIKEEIRERARLQTEMAITRNIQQSLLPSGEFRNPWCRISGVTIPATEVGGDYFDIVQLSETKVAVIIADVAGHGVQSGILSAMTKSAFHSSLQHDSSPSALLASLNATIYEVSEEKMFVTAGYILLDNESHKAFIATAGHPPLLSKKGANGSVSNHRTVSIALGMKKDTHYQHVEIPYQPGDSFLLYTDGAVEAVNPQGEQYGMERIIDTFAANNLQPVDQCSGIVASLKSFSRNDNFEDDITIVGISLI